MFDSFRDYYSGFRCDDDGYYYCWNNDYGGYCPRKDILSNQEESFLEEGKSSKRQGKKQSCLQDTRYFHSFDSSKDSLHDSCVCHSLSLDTKRILQHKHQPSLNGVVVSVAAFVVGA